MYRSLNRSRRRGGQILTFTYALAASAVAAANPRGAEVVHGTASFATPNPHTLEITNSPSAILNWQSFDIGAAETTRFIQESAASAVLNRVVGGSSSEILGNLLSNGRVFLINEAGILIGRDATIDTAGLVMSTLDIQDADFLGGRLQFAGDADNGGITNHGYIKSAPGGEIILIAPRIINEPQAGNPRSGLIESPQGDLVLAAGTAITIASLDHPDITFEVSAPENEAVNLGRLLAAGGSVSVLAGTLRHSGEINADAISRDSAGNVVLAATSTAYLDSGSRVSASGEGRAGAVAVSAGGEAGGGRIYALGTVAADGDTGGQVELAADRVLATGTLSARGAIDGGTVAVQSETEIIATASARLDASGASGQGGRVVMDGGEGTFSSALVTADGLTGGEVEVLGDEITLAGTTIDASGEAAGGRVRVGGEFRGGPGLPTATTVTANASTVIKADARAAGDGGSVVVWADGTTRYSGVISARGGAASGDGGMVETSGKEGVAIDRQPDVSAPKGEAGEWLIDPKNIVFSDETEPGAGSIQILDPHPGTDNNFGQSVQYFYEDGDFSTPAKLAVFDPLDDFGGDDAGAVYLYRLSDGALVSALTGSQNGDNVGAITLQSLGDTRVLRTPTWNADRGAVTVFDVVNGINGAVSASNSLVGANADDQVGLVSGVFSGVQSLGTRIAVRSSAFNGDRGALTIAAPMTLKGVVGSGNSLVGAGSGDQVGLNFLQSIGSGNYVLRSDHGGRGAVTFVNPAAAPKGVVGAGNSLVGAAVGDDIGSSGIQSLGSHYAVRSPNFNGTAGAVTIAPTASGISGVVSASNSLVGSAAGDNVGANALQSLFFGRYALVSDKNGEGAVTVINPAAPPVGVLSAANSLVGSGAGDAVGSGGLSYLGGTSWAVLSPSWDNGANTDAGAVTFIDGQDGTFEGTATAAVGTVGAANSLVGVTTGDAIGSDGISSVVGSISGVFSPQFDDGGSVDVGAITWYTPGTALSGAVGAANSLVGVNDNDDVGGSSNSFAFLPNGNALLIVPNFANGAGAVAWLDASGPVTGSLGAGSALVGANPGDDIGGGGIEIFSNHYLVLSPDFTDGSNANAGAVTVGANASGIIGTVSPANSFVGQAFGDAVGSGGVYALANGNALVHSPDFNSSAGAVTFYDLINGNIFGEADFTGVIDVDNSITGPDPGDMLGSGGIEVVGNHYIILSPNLGTSSGHGAVTIGDDLGASSPIGDVDATNSLIGGNFGDAVGSGGILTLFNGNVLILSPDWGSQKGAVTYVDLINGNLFGDTDFAATLDATNSLVGALAGDEVGADGGSPTVQQFFAGANQYYAVFSGSFQPGGAVTFVDAAVGIAGVVDNTNSFVGTSAGDDVGLLSGAAFFQQLSNGNGVLLSPNLSNDAGAATFVDLVNGVGLSGDIGAGNSVVGGNGGDLVGSGGVFEPSNSGIYAVLSPEWANGGQAQAGALTWGDVDSGVSGVVGPGNSLVGSTSGDDPGSGGISAFVTSGGQTRIVVESPDWDNGAAADAGAITTFLASAPKTGAIGAANSFVGSNADDRVGDGFFVTLTNANRLVVTTSWNSDAGAVTFWNTANDLTGTLGAANSLVGGNAGDGVGDWIVTEDFGSGRYYVATPTWNNDRGAVTFGSITGGRSGLVSASNSLVGSSAGDRVGESVLNLAYSDRLLVLSEEWNAERGAVTVINPAAPRVGAVSASNSLVGSSAGDRVGDFSQQLFREDNRGLVVLRTTTWGNNAGAVTVFDPLAPIVGQVSSANSLVGRAGDAVGSSGVSELSDGSLLVRSPQWSDGTGQFFGAATLMRSQSGVMPVTGFVSSDNSLVGSHADDQVGNGSFVTLPTGNILLRSPNWFDNRGAVTFINIADGRTGVVSGANSLVGELPDDFLGSGGITALGGDRALVRSPLASVNGITGAGRLDIIDGTTVQEIAGDIGFATNPGSELALSIASVVAFLNSGATLLLQANNDIYLPRGSGLVAENGTLVLEAGRSIEIEDNLIVREGTLRLLANAPGADQTYREAGDGNITVRAGETGVRVLATNLTVDAQNIFLEGGTAPNAYAAMIGLERTEVHAHGSGLLRLQAGTASGAGFTPGSASEILSAFVNDPASLQAPAAFIIGRTALNVLADDVELIGGGSPGAFAALASFGEFSVESINLLLAPGSADNADALLLGLGGVADISFTNCSGCNELLFDPLFDASSQSGIFISGLFQEPTVDAILAMLTRDSEGSDDDEDEDDDDDAAECN